MDRRAWRRLEVIKSTMLFAVGILALLLAVFPLVIWLVNVLSGTGGPGAPGSLFLLAWFLGFALAGWAAFRKASLIRARLTTESRASLILPCPECGEFDSVRGPQSLTWYWSTGRTARCLTCGDRWVVPKDQWKRLPLANPGDPYESEADRALLAANSSLTFGGMILVIGWFAAVAAIAGLLSTLIRWFFPQSEPFTLIAFVLFVTSGYGLRRLLMPKRRAGRRCIACGYDLSRCTDGSCPECGESFELGVVEAAKQTGDK